MSATFTHILITRFNLNYKELYKTKYGKDVHSDEWLLHRFSLFENYCFPSVINQSNLKFKWLVFFDSKTPISFKKNIGHFKESLENFVPIYLSSADFFLPEIKNWIAQNVNTKYIITSRLDNDDMIHRDFISAIQATFNIQNNCIVNIPNGLQLGLESNQQQLIKSFNNFGPFISLIEYNQSPSTIYFKQHDYWRGNKSVITIYKRLWVQIIHQANVLNKLKYKRNFIANPYVLENFGIATAGVKISNYNSNVMLHNIFVPVFKTIYLVKRVIKKILGPLNGK